MPRSGLVTALFTLLLLTACTGGDNDSGAIPSSADPPGTSTAAADPTGPGGGGGRNETSAAGSGSVGTEPQESPAFPADASDDGGPAQAGATSDAPGRMHVTGLRVAAHDGYDRLVIDLSSAGIPRWQVRYSEASGPGGAPVSMPGSAFLRIALATGATPGVQTTSSVTGSGVIEAARTTGFFEGSEEVLAGLRGKLPFRAFALTDPGRIVIDVRAP
jgi:hypothetical protein